MMNDAHSILLTIDVEDWFQVENFKRWIPFSSWDSRDLRVENNVHRFLDLFDSFATEKLDCRHETRHRLLNPESASAPGFLKGKPKATFFVLGWVAARLPHLVREIHARGHEIASHGYSHTVCYRQSQYELSRDLAGSKKFLEDLIGASVKGYRAPSFSINEEVLRLIAAAGYEYDSSYNSFDLHGRYGSIKIQSSHRKGIGLKISERLWELPISNITIGGQVFPVGGGAYFRLIPFRLFRMFVRWILRREKAYLFYIHPWEVDPAQPRVNEALAFYKFRHYVNLERTYPKLCKLICSFGNCRFVSCREYLKDLY
jgi:polysaccharide deacetylase family protein (PEP-CTERM system associated)